MPPMPPVCFSFSCIEPTGGSGGSADIKTFTARGLYGSLIITGTFSLGHAGTAAVNAMPLVYLQNQLDELPDWIRPAAIKVGMCPSIDSIYAIANFLREHPQIPVVLDPVMVNHLGIPLLRPEVIQAVQEHLLPRATVATPNRWEAAMLTGKDECLALEDMESTARIVFETYGCPVLLTGGAAVANSTDVFYCVDGLSHFSGDVDTHIYGSGTTLSSAITAELARGESLREAIAVAKAYVCSLIDMAPDNPGLGSGLGPLCHCLSSQPKSETSSWVRELG